MEKVKLTKEQAAALEELVVLCGELPTSQIVKEFFQTKGTPFHGERECLNALSDDEFIRALYIGYEVEPTPEEQIKVLWDLNNPEMSNDDYDRGVRSAVKEILEILKIKIKGIND